MGDHRNSYIATLPCSIGLKGVLTGKAQNYWLPTAESVAPTAISGNNESNAESKSNMNRWALQAWSSNGSSNALNVRSRAEDPSNNGASGPGIMRDGIYQKDVNTWIVGTPTRYC